MNKKQIIQVLKYTDKRLKFGVDYCWITKGGLKIITKKECYPTILKAVQKYKMPVEKIIIE